MLMEKYVNELKKLIDHTASTQKDAILKVSSVIADTVKRGGCVHVFDTGHIINNELVNRAGGLYLFRPLKYTFSVENPARPREKAPQGQEGLADYVLKTSNVLPGDVLFLGSVSGKSQAIADLAISARAMNVVTVAVTSVAYSSAVEPEHSSGKRLFELCDLVLDNCAPYGDAMLEVSGVENRVFPASGAASTLLMWCVTAQVIDLLTAGGLSPCVFQSINSPAGAEDYQRLLKRFHETGY